MHKSARFSIETVPVIQPPVPRWTIEVVPTRQVVDENVAATFAARITAFDGWVGDITLSVINVAGLPVDVTFTANPAPVGDTLFTVGTVGLPLGINDFILDGDDGVA